MLNVIVFACGAALMGLEIVAARVLAPALGNSIFVWGSVISIVMIALSLGYWLGGQVADRWGGARTLAPFIAGAGVLTMLAPVIARAVLPWCAELGPRTGALAASALIFFAPALLLATVSPLGISIAAARGLDRIGRSTGGLYAISTAGSIVGTIATSFWLIPLLSLEPLIVAIGFTLFAAALAALTLPAIHGEDRDGCLPTPKERRVARGVLAATMVLATAGTALGAFVLVRVAPAPDTNETGERVLFRADTQYHRVTVTEDATTRHLRFDKSNQSAIDIADGYTSRIRYPDYMHLAMALKPDAKKVLVLGLGGGAISKRYWRDYPGVSVDSVEIDPVVVDVAKRYFSLPEDDRFRVYTQDARRFVQSSTDTYDIVIFDCYYDEALPFHLTTEEFLREVKARMAPDGVIAYNVISAVEGDKSRLFRSMYRTAGGVWDHLSVFPIGIGADKIAISRRNVIVLATDADVTNTDLVHRIGDRIDGRVSIAGYPEMALDLYTGMVPVADVPKMTDAYAPTDSLIDVK
ncbi:MAG: fused MFS/spermidine synthase [Coriobacteriia bacterium]|nr:fused MFS/spermidine synthase [Coriobacteriia bacterium]